MSVIGGDEGVEVGFAKSARDVTDEVDLAASSARFASIACLWAERAGAAELEESRSFPDATSNRFGCGAGGVVSAVIRDVVTDRRGHVLGLYFPFSTVRM